MNRRETMKLLGATVLAGAVGLSSFAWAQDQKKMVTVVKIAGIPWFNALENGIKKAATDFSIDASMVGPANVDPAQQVKLLEDLIAQKVDVIGLVPLDVKVAEPVLKRAQEAGIPVITHEGPEQEGRTWNVELIDSVQFGEVQMQRLAKEMGEEGEYVVYVGTLTTPLHNIWADSAIAYQEKNYPNMKLVTDRFPGADEIDTSYKTTLDVIKAYPNLKGILGFGSNGPIGAGNAVREKRLGKKIAVVGTVLPSQ
ncbi:MAG: substrate-binding domain-containing protein, partial [Pseudomonadota bacterium]|nr:substrate-binding domain-containing protein [Pseudomonadota bacterium]